MLDHRSIILSQASVVARAKLVFRTVPVSIHSFIDAGLSDDSIIPASVFGHTGDISIPKCQTRAPTQARQSSTVSTHETSHSIDTMATSRVKQTATARDNFDDVSHDAPNNDTPPDGGYGWACVAACFTVNCFTWGTVSVGNDLFGLEAILRRIPHMVTLRSS